MAPYAGFSIFGVSLPRLSLRAFIWKIPKIRPEPPKYFRWLSGGAHVALYAFLIAVPLAGWLILSVESRTIVFWGWSLPPISGPDANLARPLEELHERAGTAGYFLIGLHAAAALIHHFVVKDNGSPECCYQGRMSLRHAGADRDVLYRSR